MITLKGVTETSYTVKKSKFLGLAVRVDTEEQAHSQIEKRKKQHYDATHNCWAYLFESGAMRYSDDGEPSGTAGLPMLEVLKASGLTDVLFICTRYFGGTLLGAGGLVRAYSKSAADTLEAAQKVRLMPCSVYRCSFPYGVWAKAENVLISSGCTFEDTEFAQDVAVTACVTAGKEDAFLELIQNLSLGKTEPAFLGQKLVEAPVEGQKL